MSVNIQKQTKLPAHKWQVSSVEFSPDGLFLASGSWDKTAIIWDLSTLERSQTIRHHTQPVTCVSFQPMFSKNGLLVTGSADHTVALWNHSTGGLVQSFQNHSNWVLSTSFSPDGRLLATASRDKLICVVDVETGKVVGNLAGHTTGVWTCSFNPEQSTTSDTLCSGSEDGGLKLWDMRDNSVVMSLVGGHEDRVKSCSWSSRGNYVASSSSDGKLALWEPRSGTALTKIKAYDDSANAVKFYPVINESTVPLLFSVGNHTCNVWHPFRKQSKQLLSYKVNENSEEVQALSISPDGTLLATGGNEKDVVLSSITISLEEIDALPIDTGEKNMNRGTLLWKKYTRKVIEKTNTDGEREKKTSITDQSQNSALIVGMAVHKNEEVVKKHVEKAGTLHYSAAEKLHAEPEVILQHQKQKLRHRKGNGGLFDLQNQEEQKSAPSSPVVQSQLEEIRQQLRKVNRPSIGSSNRIENSEQESAISKVNGWNTVIVQNGDHQNGHPPTKNSWREKGVVVSIDSDNESTSRQRNGRPPQQANGYGGSHIYSTVSDQGVNIQQSSRYQPFSIPTERDRMSNGNDDQESTSASSSSYYADIDDVAQEMLDLTRKVENHRL